MQMAIDEAILEAHRRQLVPPTLRVYRFSPPAITIGLNQKLPDHTIASINAKGIDVVRRPTGGRAVLHLNDLTYSFIGSDKSIGGILATSVTESYKQICAGLIDAFKVLGVESELGSAGSSYRHLQDCFMATTGSDLHHKGTKLIGSAQLRRGGAVLQHGSVPLDQDLKLMGELLGQPVVGQQRHVNLFAIAARTFGFDELEQAFVAGFSQSFGVQFDSHGLTDWEIAWAQSKAADYRVGHNCGLIAAGQG